MTEKNAVSGVLDAGYNEKLMCGQVNLKSRGSKEMSEQKTGTKKFLVKIKQKTKQKSKKIKAHLAPLSTYDVFETLCVFCVFNYFVGGMDMLANDFGSDKSYGNQTGIYEGPGVVDAVHEAYDPFFHGSTVYNQISYHDSHVNDRFIRHMCLLGVEALFLSSFILYVLRKKRLLKKDVDIVFEIEKAGKLQNVDSELIQRVTNIAGDIVDHMSTENKLPFKKLIKEALNNNQSSKSLELANALLMEHLRHHPEDKARVLEEFGEDFLMQNIFAEFRQNVR